MIRNHLLCCFLLFSVSAFSQVQRIKVSVYFDNDQHALRKDARQTLNMLADSIKGLDITRIVTKGNTDSNADSLYNVKLSDRRTQAVTDYLVGKGLNQKLFIKEYYGENQPLASNDSDKGKQENRRVDIYVFYKVKKAPVIPEVKKDSVVPVVVTQTVKPPPRPAPCTEDTLITLSNGTTLTFNKCEYLERKDCLDIAGVLSAEEALNANLTSVDDGGNALGSEGMLNIQPKPGCDGGCFKHPVIVRIPVRKNCMVCGRSMAFYDLDENGRWKENNEKIKKVTINGIEYYEFKMLCPGGKNYDCKIKTRKVRVRVPRDYVIASVTLTSDCPLGIYPLKRTWSKHVMKGKVPCFVGDGDITATLKDSDSVKWEVKLQPLNNQRYRRFCLRCKASEVSFTFLGIDFHKRQLRRKYKVRQENITRVAAGLQSPVGQSPEKPD